MSGVRIPDLVSRGAGTADNALDLLAHEIAAEKASALGRAGEAVEKALAGLKGLDVADPSREARLRDAAKAVHAYFIQRELCGMRRHDAVIREYGIPRAVLARLGAA